MKITKEYRDEKISQIEKIMPLLDKCAAIMGKESWAIYFVHSTFATLGWYLEDGKYQLATWEIGLQIDMDELEKMIAWEDASEVFELLAVS